MADAPVSDPPVEPWQSPWMWLGTVASILLGGALLVPRIPALDRTSMTVPLLVGVAAGALATAFGTPRSDGCRPPSGPSS